jgi:hypothetical protein
MPLFCAERPAIVRIRRHIGGAACFALARGAGKAPVTPPSALGANNRLERFKPDRDKKSRLRGSPSDIRSDMNFVRSWTRPHAEANRADPSNIGAIVEALSV